MTEAEFWDHIRATKRKDPEAHAERLVKRLAKLPPEEILDFEHWWSLMWSEAYQADLWGAAYIINGGASEDGFAYFRDWLILQGREVCKAAIANPDSLADVVGRDTDADCECYPGHDAWFQATGTEPDDDGHAAFYAALAKRHPGRHPRREFGKSWNFEDSAMVRKRLPRLAKMYLDDGD